MLYSDEGVGKFSQFSLDRRNREGSESPAVVSGSPKVKKRTRSTSRMFQRSLNREHISRRDLREAKEARAIIGSLLCSKGASKTSSEPVQFCHSM